ncbi:RNA polymerase sigma factor [Actinomadura decatromicini]|uniref:Sigma-70 family RNA polymerase sigma factor n=1 Tax=Actinomadura decatromicini TaxID=2604572 RepID=A0A5D3FKZ0_9ACTN|nr:hypothetical protein [Actinomadura decatromicini]TYK48951.1 hypothetical protein FXF68_13955 [Actinomadura decatromicini]
MGVEMSSLYDAHADRLYAYCWSLLGDRDAPAAVGDAFAAAVHHPPRGDRVLWLYSLARSACAERGAFTGPAGRAAGRREEPLFAASDPLLRAAAGLRSDHREVLLLWAGEWLEPHDIALVLGIAPDTVAQLLNAARTRLERAVLDFLMRGTTEPRLDLISAFEKGRLPQLLARRAPSGAPRELRHRVLAACEAEASRPLPTVAAPSPLIVIGSEQGRPGRSGPDAPAGPLSKGLGAAAGLAAAAAAVVGLLASWPTSGKGEGAASLVPTASTDHTNPASTRTNGVLENPRPGLTGTERASEHPPKSVVFGDPRQERGTPHRTPSPVPSPSDDPSGSPSPGKDPSRAPTDPGDPSTPPTTPPPSPGDPSTPPTGGPTDPTTPPTGAPTDPPVEGPGTGAPSPTSNPTPSPETSQGG